VPEHELSQRFPHRFEPLPDTPENRALSRAGGVYRMADGRSLTDAVMTTRMAAHSTNGSRHEP
jgi:hypothetical protein